MIWGCPYCRKPPCDASSSVWFAGWPEKPPSMTWNGGGFHQWGYPNTWMVYFMKNLSINGWELGVPLLLRKPPEMTSQCWWLQAESRPLRDGSTKTFHQDPTKSTKHKLSTPDQSTSRLWKLGGAPPQATAVTAVAPCWRQWLRGRRLCSGCDAPRLDSMEFTKNGDVKIKNQCLVGGWATPLKNMKVNWDD